MKNILHALYRIWFYTVVLFVTLLLSPFLVLSILREPWYPFFFKLAKVWGTFILWAMGFRLKIKRDVTRPSGKSYMFVANHTSMIDIMLMYHTVHNPFVFVGKAELAKIPLFGFFYKRSCILVDRKNRSSRGKAFMQAQRRMQNGMSICIFPEGGIPSNEAIVLDRFKDGAFRLAIEHQTPIAPLTFHDNKKRFSYKFFSGSPGKMRVRVHKPIPTVGMGPEDKQALMQTTRNVILSEL
ncbi:MAG: lysophospholipid acyltransferase family protein, partial [Marinirhabdus sp.]